MEISVKIPSSLAAAAGGSKALTFSGASVSEIFAVMTTKHPDLRRAFLKSDGSLNGYTHVFINDVDIWQLDGFETKLKKNDRLNVIVAMSGG